MKDTAINGIDADGHKSPSIAPMNDLNSDKLSHNSATGESPQKT